MSIVNKVFQGNSFTRKATEFINWTRKYSLDVITVSNGCSASREVLKKLSLPGNRCSPDQLPTGKPAVGDVLIVAGCFSQQNSVRLKKYFQQLSWPRRVLALGSCAICGGRFKNYSTVQGIDDILPVDVYVPGCPPSIPAIKSGLNMVRKKFDDCSLTPYAKVQGTSPEGEDEL